MSLNKYLFHGTLGGDAEVKNLDKGSVITFSVAITEKWTDKNSGEKKEKTMWVKCNKWVAVNGSIKIAEYLKKGTQVIIDGIPEAKAWKNKDGEAQANLEVKVNDLTLVGSGKKSESTSESTGSDGYAQSSGSYQTPSTDDSTSDDLPF